MAEVRVDNLTKKFGDLTAVNDLSLQVHDGEFVVFLGPSGCGKTTTLRCIAGLEIPDGGTISIGGDIVTKLPPALRDIAFVFQQYALYPHMTVFDNLAFPMRATRTPKEEIAQRIKEVSEILHIERLLSRRPGKLSGGEMQRVAIGRAMVRRPKVFLMDEPLTNLDAKLRTEMRAELKRLQSDLGATTIYVTHDQIEAMSMGDRVAVINGGKLLQFGTPMEVYDHPASMFVAGFIGSPAMNFAPCRREGGEVVLQTETMPPPFTSPASREGSEATGETDIESPKGSAPMFAGEGRGGGSSSTIRATGEFANAPEGKDLVLGVRPEDIELSMTDKPESLRAEVYVVEPLGSENIIDIDLSGQKLKCRTAPTFLPNVGSPIFARIDMARSHLFDTATGEAYF